MLQGNRRTSGVPGKQSKGVSVLKVDKSVLPCDRLSFYIHMLDGSLLFASLARGMSSACFPGSINDRLRF